MGSEILDFGSHYSANFQPILDCFIPKFKLKYDNLENIKTDCVNTVGLWVLIYFYSTIPARNLSLSQSVHHLWK